jgi:hypothetical protein
VTGRWSDLDDGGRAVAAAVFGAQDAAHALEQGTTPAMASQSAVWSALMSGSPLPAGLRPGVDLDGLLERAAPVTMPRLSAADSGGHGVDRQASGVRVRVMPSRAEASQSYLLITVADPRATLRRLVVTRDSDAPAEQSLPSAVGDTIQVLLDGNAPILAALADPDSRIFLI